MSFFVKSWLKFEEKIHASVDLLQNTTSFVVELNETVERNPRSDNPAASTRSKMAEILGRSFELIITRVVSCNA